MSKNNTSVSFGGGFLGLLTLIFIVLKLLDKIDWSWGWVLSPIWIPIALFLILLMIIFIVSAIGFTIDNIRLKK